MSGEQIATQGMAAAIWAVPLLCPGLVVLVWASYASHRARRTFEEDVPPLCFRYARQYENFLYATWIFAVIFGLGHDPLNRFAGAANKAEEVESAMRLVFLFVMAGGPLIIARARLFPLFARYPETTWRRKHFWMQGFWANLRAGALVLLLLYLINHGPSARHLLIAVPCVGLFAFIATFFYQHALGAHSQILGEGEAYERIMAAAARLKFKPRVEMVHYTQCPMGSVLQLGSDQIRVSNVALATLTREEFDAVVLDGLLQIALRNRGLPGSLPIDVGFGLTSDIAALGATSGLSARPLRENIPEELEDVESSIDPRTLIRGLGKLARLCRTMRGASDTESRSLADKAIAQWVKQIAERNQIGAEEIASLLEGSARKSDLFYPIPGSENEGELLDVSVRQRGAWAFAVLAFVVPLLPAVVMAASHFPTGNLAASEYAALCAAAAVGTVLLYMLQNYAELEGGAYRRSLEKRLRDSDTWDLDGFYIGLAPCSDKLGVVRYGGSEIWDEGYLSLLSANITFQGTKASFSIPRELVLNIRLTREFPGLLLPFYRIRIDWKADGYPKPRTFTLGVLSSIRRSRINRDNHRLFQELAAWHTQDAIFRPSSGPPAYPVPNGLNPAADIIGYAPILTSITVCILMPLTGAVLSAIFGLPVSGPLSASMRGVLVTSCYFAVLLSGVVVFHRTYGARTVDASRTRAG